MRLSHPDAIDPIKSRFLAGSHLQSPLTFCLFLSDIPVVSGNILVLFLFISFILLVPYLRILCSFLYSIALVHAFAFETLSFSFVHSFASHSFSFPSFVSFQRPMSCRLDIQCFNKRC